MNIQAAELERSDRSDKELPGGTVEFWKKENRCFTSAGRCLDVSGVWKMEEYRRKRIIDRENNVEQRLIVW